MGAAFTTAAGTLATHPERSEAGTFHPRISEGVFDTAQACRLLFHEPGDVADFVPGGVWHPGVRIVLYHDGLTRRPVQYDRITARDTVYSVTAVRGLPVGAYASDCDVDAV